DCLAESNPDRRTSKRQPTALRVKPVTSENHAWQNWNLRNMRQRRSTGTYRRAFEQRLSTVANAAFRKNADHAPIFQTLHRGANCFAVCTMAFSRERINRAKKQSHDWHRKKFCHCHPIDLSSHDRRDDERIEMTDVVRRD